MSARMTDGYDLTTTAAPETRDCPLCHTTFMADSRQGRMISTKSTVTLNPFAFEKYGKLEEGRIVYHLTNKDRVWRDVNDAKDKALAALEAERNHSRALFDMLCRVEKAVTLGAHGMLEQDHAYYALADIHRAIRMRENHVATQKP